MKKGPKANVELTGEPVFDWDKTAGSMLVVAFQQKTSLRFRIVRNMDYMIEIARYDTYDVPKNALQTLTNQMKKPQISQPIIREEDPSQRTNWGATLWKSSWDDQFVPNTTLGIGQQAYWDPKIGAWFPDPPASGASKPAEEGEVSEGVKEFLQIVGEVNRFLHDIKKGGN